MISKKEISNTFLKQDRLNTADEYSQVFKNAKRLSDEFLTVLVRNSKEPQAKLGLAIAKKQVKKAVLRNQIKRVVREAFRLRKQSLRGFDIVVLCRHKAGNISKTVLSGSINKHFDKLLKNE